MNSYFKKVISKNFIKYEQFYKRILGNKTRFQLLNFLIEKHNYNNYLEIGIQNGFCLKSVKCINKVGVDPNPLIDSIKHTQIIKTTSDDFFLNCKDKFDLIFIDGLHTYEQSYKDFHNAKDFLNDNGRIVLHDCNPITEERSRSFSDGGKFNGDVFKTIIKLNASGNYFIQTVDIDQGCGVIKLDKTNVKFDYELNYDWFDNNRIKSLNLVSWQTFVNQYKV